MSHTAGNIATFLTSLLGVASLSDAQFNPLVFFFYFAGIIVTAMIIGYITEAGFDKIKNRKKSNEMGVGSRHI